MGEDKLREQARNLVAWLLSEAILSPMDQKPDPYKTVAGYIHRFVRGCNNDASTVRRLFIDELPRTIKRYDLESLDTILREDMIQRCRWWNACTEDELKSVRFLAETLNLTAPGSLSESINIVGPGKVTKPMSPMLESTSVDEPPAKKPTIEFPDEPTVTRTCSFNLVRGDDLYGGNGTYDNPTQPMTVSDFQTWYDFRYSNYKFMPASIYPLEITIPWDTPLHKLSWKILAAAVEMKTKVPLLGEDKNVDDMLLRFESVCHMVAVDATFVRLVRANNLYATAIQNFIDSLEVGLSSGEKHGCHLESSSKNYPLTLGFQRLIDALTNLAHLFHPVANFRMWSDIVTDDPYKIYVENACAKQRLVINVEKGEKFEVKDITLELKGDITISVTKAGLKLRTYYISPEQLHGITDIKVDQAHLVLNNMFGIRSEEHE